MVHLQDATGDMNSDPVERRMIVRDCYSDLYRKSACDPLCADELLEHLLQKKDLLQKDMLNRATGMEGFNHFNTGSGKDEHMGDEEE